MVRCAPSCGREATAKQYGLRAALEIGKHWDCSLKFSADIGIKRGGNFGGRGSMSTRISTHDPPLKSKGTEGRGEDSEVDAP